MATKLNMYKEKIKQARKIIEKIDSCVIAWDMNNVGIHQIGIYQIEKAEAVRNEVANMQGQLEVLLNGLDKSSPKRKEYQNLLNIINEFMELFEA